MNGHSKMKATVVSYKVVFAASEATTKEIISSVTSCLPCCRHRGISKSRIWASLLVFIFQFEEGLHQDEIFTRAMTIKDENTTNEQTHNILYASKMSLRIAAFLLWV